MLTVSHFGRDCEQCCRHCRTSAEEETGTVREAEQGIHGAEHSAEGQSAIGRVGDVSAREHDFDAVLPVNRHDRKTGESGQEYCVPDNQTAAGDWPDDRQETT